METPLFSPPRLFSAPFRLTRGVRRIPPVPQAAPVTAGQSPWDRATARPGKAVLRKQTINQSIVWAAKMPESLLGQD